MFPKSKQVLGVNARNRVFLRFNTKKGRKIADSKLLTKKKLRKAHLPAPKLIKVFKDAQQVQNFDWMSLPDNFVLKPVSGFGGEGIVVVKKRAKFAGEWRLMDNSIITLSELKQQSLDILAGRYSLHNLPDKAMIEERIKISKTFRHYAHQGTPDIRIIVFNRVPVVAMLRLPTVASKGKANLHQGALGLGIDLATGITTHAITTFGVLDARNLKYIPGTKRKVNGLKIPNWTTFLTLAVKAQEVVPELGFLGVDLFLDKEKGPMIVELNARPGLWAQQASMMFLKKRLERVEGLDVRDADHGVRIARALFAARFADQVMIKEGLQILKVWEKIRVLSFDRKQKQEVKAKIDTGAWRTSVDKDFASQLGLLGPENILWKKTYRSGLGKDEREAIGLTFYLRGRKIKTVANVAERSELRASMIIGRRDLVGFLIRPRG